MTPGDMLLLAQKQYTVYVTRTTAGFQICVQDNTLVFFVTLNY